MQLTDLARQRRSSRAVDPDRRVDDATLAALFEAARWAPGSRNEQPWRYVVFDDRDPESLAEARACLRPTNAWALAAPVLVLSLAATHYGDGRPNRFASFEAGMASILAALRAEELNLVFHQMSGFDPDQARRQFAVGDDLEILALIAIGHRLDPERWSEEQREYESGSKPRRPLSETVRRSRLDGPALTTPEETS